MRRSQQSTANLAQLLHSSWASSSTSSLLQVTPAAAAEASLQQHARTTLVGTARWGLLPPLTQQQPQHPQPWRSSSSSSAACSLPAQHFRVQWGWCGSPSSTRAFSNNSSSSGPNNQTTDPTQDQQQQQQHSRLHGIHPSQQPGWSEVSARLNSGSRYRNLDVEPFHHHLPSPPQQQQQVVVQGEVTGITPAPSSSSSSSNGNGPEPWGEGSGGFRIRSLRRKEPQFQVIGGVWVCD